MENKRSNRVTGYKGSHDKYQLAERIQHSFVACLLINMNSERERDTEKEKQTKREIQRKIDR